VKSEQTNPAEGISGITSEGEVPVEGDASLGEGVAAQHVLHGDVSASKVLNIFLFLAGSFVEGPVLVGVIDGQDCLRVEIERLQHDGKTLAQCEVAVKGLDVVLAFVEAISIEYLGNLMASDGASLVDVEIDLESMEVAA
jgi:hypothetical protein